MKIVSVQYKKYFLPLRKFLGSFVDVLKLTYITKSTVISEGLIPRRMYFPIFIKFRIVSCFMIIIPEVHHSLHIKNTFTSAIVLRLYVKSALSPFQQIKTQLLFAKIL